MFDTLVKQNESLKPMPGLALSWKPISDLVWEFKLRPGVKFHDGSDFTAEDVVFTYERVRQGAQQPRPLHDLYAPDGQVRDRRSAHLAHSTPTTPAPLLPLDVAALPILSKKAAAGPAPEGKTSAELNAGNGLVGTGPFKFVSWQRGNSLVLERNDTYWDGSAVWPR